MYTYISPVFSDPWKRFSWYHKKNNSLPVQACKCYLRLENAREKINSHYFMSRAFPRFRRKVHITRRVRQDGFVLRNIVSVVTACYYYYLFYLYRFVRVYIYQRGIMKKCSVIRILSQIQIYVYIADCNTFGTKQFISLAKVCLYCGATSWRISYFSLKMYNRNYRKLHYRNKKGINKYYLVLLKFAIYSRVA